MREGFVFYRSFFEAMNELPDKDFAIVFKALCGYALDNIMPELTGIHKALFELMKPQIDANNRRYENGKRGGRPAKEKNQSETKPKPNHNQSETKVKPKEKEKEKEKDKEKDKDNDNDKEKEYTPEGADMIHDDLQQRIVSELNHNEPIPHYYFKYLDKWVDDYGADFVVDAINGLADESKSLTGLMIEVTARARKGTH